MRMVSFRRNPREWQLYGFPCFRDTMWTQDGDSRFIGVSLPQWALGLTPMKGKERSAVFPRNSSFRETISCLHWSLLTRRLSESVLIRCLHWSFWTRFLLESLTISCLHWSLSTRPLLESMLSCLHWSPLSRRLLESVLTSCLHWSFWTRFLLESLPISCLHWSLLTRLLLESLPISCLHWSLSTRRLLECVFYFTRRFELPAMFNTTPSLRGRYSRWLRGRCSWRHQHSFKASHGQWARRLPRWSCEVRPRILRGKRVEVKTRFSRRHFFSLNQFSRK